MRVFGLGPTELLIILAIILLLFGPKQIPKLAKMFGKAAKDMREGFEGKDDEELGAAPEAKQAIPPVSAPGQEEAATPAEKQETPS